MSAMVIQWHVVIGISDRAQSTPTAPDDPKRLKTSWYTGSASNNLMISRRAQVCSGDITLEHWAVHLMVSSSSAGRQELRMSTALASVSCPLSGSDFSWSHDDHALIPSINLQVTSALASDTAVTERSELTSNRSWGWNVDLDRMK